MCVCVCVCVCVCMWRGWQQVRADDGWSMPNLEQGVKDVEPGNIRASQGVRATEASPHTPRQQDSSFSLRRQRSHSHQDGTREQISSRLLWKQSRTDVKKKISRHSIWGQEAGQVLPGRISPWAYMSFPWTHAHSARRWVWAGPAGLSR